MGYVIRKVLSITLVAVLIGCKSTTPQFDVQYGPDFKGEYDKLSLTFYSYPVNAYSWPIKVKAGESIVLPEYKDTELLTRGDTLNGEAVLLKSDQAANITAMTTSNVPVLEGALGSAVGMSIVNLVVRKEEEQKRRWFDIVSQSSANANFQELFTLFNDIESPTWASLNTVVVNDVPKLPQVSSGPSLEMILTWKLRPEIGDYLAVCVDFSTLSLEKSINESLEPAQLNITICANDWQSSSKRKSFERWEQGDGLLVQQATRESIELFMDVFPIALNNIVDFSEETNGVKEEKVKKALFSKLGESKISRIDYIESPSVSYDIDIEI